MANNTDLDSLFNSLSEDELNEPLPYNFRTDYDMRDLQEPEDLWVTLKENFGDNFENATQEQKFTLISIVSFVLLDGGRFFNACREWVGIAELLPIEVIGSELNHSKGVDLLRALTASLSNELV